MVIWLMLTCIKDYRHRVAFFDVANTEVTKTAVFIDFCKFSVLNVRKNAVVNKK